MGERLKQARLDVGLSRREAADAVNVHLNTILNWEDKGVEVPGSKLAALSALYKCSVEYLLGLADEKNFVVI